MTPGVIVIGFPADVAPLTLHGMSAVYARYPVIVPNDTAAAKPVHVDIVLTNRPLYTDVIETPVQRNQPIYDPRPRRLQRWARRPR